MAEIIHVYPLIEPRKRHWIAARLWNLYINRCSASRRLANSQPGSFAREEAWHTIVYYRTLIFGFRQALEYWEIE